MLVIFFQPMHLSLRSFTKSSTPLYFGIHIPELLIHTDILIYPRHRTVERLGALHGESLDTTVVDLVVNKYT